MKKFATQFVTYGIIGLGATIIDMVLLYFLVEVVLSQNPVPIFPLEKQYIAAIPMAFCVAAIFNFSMQKKHTFKNRSTKLKSQLSIFITSAVIGVGINIFLISMLDNAFGWHYMVGKVFATGITFVWNFLVNKFITFK